MAILMSSDPLVAPDVVGHDEQGLVREEPVPVLRFDGLGRWPRLWSIH